MRNTNNVFLNSIGDLKYFDRKLFKYLTKGR